MRIDYNGKVFQTVENTSNGETSMATRFFYQQEGNILTATYAGGAIRKGHLLGVVQENGVIEMRYHQINNLGELLTGECTSVPEILPNGKIRLHETWRWTSGDKSFGKSIIEEI